MIKKLVLAISVLAVGCVENPIEPTIYVDCNCNAQPASGLYCNDPYDGGPQDWNVWQDRACLAPAVSPPVVNVTLNWTTFVATVNGEVDKEYWTITANGALLLECDGRRDSRCFVKNARRATVEISPSMRNENELIRGEYTAENDNGEDMDYAEFRAGE